VFFDQTLGPSSKPIFLEDFQPQSCVAQSSGDEQIIPNPRAASEEEVSFLALSQKADIDDDLFGERSIPSDQVHSKSFRSVLETPVEERDERKRKIFGNAKGDEEIFWNPPHGSNVAEVYEKGFPAKMEGICPSQLEVNVFDEKVCGDQPYLFTHFDDRHIISNTFQ